jgi:2'-deoxynucleoside 5'-phosphate N-hydrolase
MSAISVYISGPLTVTADRRAARAYYERIAALCTGLGWVPYLPHTENDPEEHPDVPAEEVFKRDAAKLLGADLVVAFVGAPSLGVGAELALAMNSDIPILAICRPNEIVSRFVLGMLARHGNRVLAVDDTAMENELPKAMLTQVKSVR